MAKRSYTTKRPTIKCSLDIGKEPNNLNLDSCIDIPKLREFNVMSKEDRLPNGFFIICEGSRRVGKSIFLKWLLYHYKDDFDLAIVFSETPHNGFWQPIVSNEYVHNGWDPFAVEKLLASQEEEKEKEVKSGGRHKMRRVLIILDDIVGDRKHIHEDTMLNRLAVQGRHFGISVCLTTQEPHAIGTALRNNCDMAVIFQQKSERAKKSVSVDFLMFKLDDEHTARCMLKMYTEGHNAILVRMYTLENKINMTYCFVPESMTYDKQADKLLVPNYQLGTKDQQQLARTAEGSKPLFASTTTKTKI
jgi:hypothetical protein